MRRRRKLLVIGTSALAAILATVWLTRFQWGVPMIVAAPSPGFDPIDAPPDAQLVEVETEDARLRAWHFTAEQPRGTIIVLHGIHDDKTSQLGTVRRIVGQGYNALAVDLRGHGESSGAWLSYGVRESRDLVHLTDELEERGLFVAPLAVHGTSYGAATAIQYAAIDTRVKTVVAIAPFASLREIVPIYARGMAGPLAVAVSDELLSALVTEAGRAAEFDPDAACPRCVAPDLHASLLIVHSRDDERIPWEHSQTIFDAAASERSRLVLVDGPTHLTIGTDSNVHRTVDAWLDEQVR